MMWVVAAVHGLARMDDVMKWPELQWWLFKYPLAAVHTPRQIPQRIKPAQYVARELVNEGAALHGSGQYADALRCYERALAFDKTNAIVWMNSGLALYALGRTDNAIQCLKTSVGIQSDNDRAWSALGTALHQAGEYAQAAACYQNALKRNPNNATAKTNMEVLTAEASTQPQGQSPQQGMQRFLKERGCYGGEIDGQFGLMSCKALQHYLQQQGHYNGEVDGIWGPKTRQAMQAWQKVMGVKPSGEIDGPTVDALRKDCK
ncbi:MAG TPA: tetratricopeptide repeat protein [Verrucomicrobiota bacterium]|nr:tetratricopeptide repeat protein [Verrucomicrobiota bacterium]